MGLYLLIVKFLTILLSLLAFILFVCFAALPVTLEEKPMTADLTTTPITVSVKPSKFSGYSRFMGPLTYTMHFCTMGDWYPMNSNVTEYRICAYSKSTLDRFLYGAFSTRYQTVDIFDGSVKYRIYTMNETTTFVKGDTKAYYDMVIDISQKQTAAFVLALLAAVCNFAIMAGAFYTHIIVKSKIFMVVASVVSGILGICAAALSTTAFPKGTFVDTYPYDDFNGVSTIGVTLDFSDAFKVTGGAALVIVAVIASVLSLVPPLFARSDD
jgi:hypothetical protein